MLKNVLRVPSVQPWKVSLRWFTTTAFLCNQKFQLRPYQEDCIKACVDELEVGDRRIAVSLPTGAGKTVIFTHLIDQVKPKPGQGGKTMILVHRRELAFQAAETCRRSCPDKRVEVEMGDFRATPDADIVIASVQTLVRSRRYENFDPDDFKMIVIDECHHAAADSYMEVLDHFKIFDSKSNVALVGFSATLRREDEKNLDSTFDKIVFHLDLEKLIFDKHLVDAKFTTVRLANADLGNVKSARGDFVIKGLSGAMNKEENSKVILGTYLHFAKEHNVKSTMLFGVDIAHVESLCQVFRAHGVNAEYITSKTKKDVRSRVISDFKAGKISVLMNCGIFTEGTDMPNIDCILLVRPTRSKTLLIQMIGRGLRLHESKDFCHIVDFVGINNTSVITVPSLRNLPAGYEVEGMSFKDMDEQKKVLDLEKAKEEEALKAEEEAAALKKEDESAQSMNILRSKLDSLLNPNYDRPLIENLELTTFGSLQDFVKSTNGQMPDFVQVIASRFPWIKGPTKYIWILDDSNAHSTSHFRLEIHPNGLRNGFLDDVTVDNIYYAPAKLKDINEKLCTLTRYSERIEFKRRRSFYETRWDADLCCPISLNIKDPLMYVESLLLNKSSSSHRDLTKFATWRSNEPTQKQMELLTKLAKKSLTDIEFAHFEANVQELSKGDVTNALFGYNVFRTKGLKAALPKGLLK